MKPNQKPVLGLLAVAATVLASSPATAGCEQGDARCIERDVMLVLEEALDAHGYYPGQIDGRYDEKTANALAHFKLDRGFARRPDVSDEVIIALGLDRDLRYGIYGY